MADPIEIDSLDDPRVAPYHNLKDRELAKDGGRFIAEGELVVRRLLASDYPTESVLLARRQVPDVLPLVSPGVPVYVADASLIHQIIGYRFHSGVLAVGRRKANLSLEAVVPPPPAPALLMICPDLISTDNLGSLVRLAAGFGADAVVLGERCCDPFFRHAVRVSMGNVFRVPLVRSGDVLAPEHAAACDRRVTLPMWRDTDSLNVATAAAVFLYHFTRGRAARQGWSHSVPVPVSVPPPPRPLSPP